MAGVVGSKVTLTLALDTAHWRRHDRAFWAQVLANAANEAAPGVMQVRAFELQDSTVVLRLRASKSAKQIQKLWREDESFLRLRARFADLGARPDLDVEEDRV
ncbi:MAG: hypothetical protein R3C25_06890 [Hyphomonadaceae bacterium]